MSTIGTRGGRLSKAVAPAALAQFGRRGIVAGHVEDASDLESDWDIGIIGEMGEWHLDNADAWLRRTMHGHGPTNS